LKGLRGKKKSPGLDVEWLGLFVQEGKGQRFRYSGLRVASILVKNPGGTVLKL